jgi:hypothetical protein
LQELNSKCVVVVVVVAAAAAAAAAVVLGLVLVLVVSEVNEESAPVPTANDCF